MASPSPTAFSWRGLLQSLFDVEDDALGSRASPLAAAPTPRWSRRSAADAPPRSPSASSAAGDDAARPYAASRLDGEFNVWFARKPLGLGLVPSTQLYGTWEISSVASAVASSHHATDDARERAKIQRGDVVVAVNFNTRVAQMPRDAFAAYLQQSACPLVVTLRRPALYGSFDSRAMSTAMFPASIEYRGKNADLDHKTFLTRAPSRQWQRSLQHELKQQHHKQKAKATRQTNAATTRSPRNAHEHAHEPTPEADPSSATSSPSGAVEAMATRQGFSDVGTRPRNLSTAELTPMGEYTATFHEVPLRVTLAPSTRLYGSVEVYDATHYAPLVQIGDVLMAVNGDTSVAKWPTDDAIDHVAGLQAPVTITFRRPAAYRNYLETYFKTTHAQVSSRSMATAMFPDSAEYKHGHYRLRKNKKKSERTTLSRQGSLSSNDPSSLPSAMTPQQHRRVEGQGKMTKEEWQRVSKALSSSDQFKLWQSGASKRAAAKGKKKMHTDVATEWLHTSAFLTERHVHYLWAHLPEYLTCNDMELVYDTRHHGWNLLSFYARVEDKGPTLLVVKDTHDQIFGAFSSTSWKQSTDVYGNGRCFVFSLRPQMKVYAWSGLDGTFMYGRRDSLMMGGGKKGIALCLQLDELRGFSHACDTFDSPPLAPVSKEGGAFEMENVEVWCFSGLRV